MKIEELESGADRVRFIVHLRLAIRSEHVIIALTLLALLGIGVAAQLEAQDPNRFLITVLLLAPVVSAIFLVAVFRSWTHIQFEVTRTAIAVTLNRHRYGPDKQITLQETWAVTVESNTRTMKRERTSVKVKTYAIRCGSDLVLGKIEVSRWADRIAARLEQALATVGAT